MRNRVVVLSLTKNEIIVKTKKKRVNKSIYVNSSLLIIIAIIGLCLFNDSVSKNFISVYNPVNSLYSDNSNIVFTSGSVDKLDFSLPILGAQVNCVDGVIEFVAMKSIMVVAPENGVVMDIGDTLDGIKYIKIKHSENVYSVIENLDIIGVSKNDLIKKGQDIATAKIGNKVIMKIYEEDNRVRNLNIDKSKIIWQS